MDIFCFSLSDIVLNFHLRLHITFHLAGNGAVSIQNAGTTGTEESTSSIHSFFFGNALQLFIYLVFFFFLGDKGETRVL